MTRSALLAAAGVAVVAAHKHLRVPDLRADVPLVAVPLNFSSVVLTPGSRFDVMRTTNRNYLLNLDSARLMCLYTSAANLTGTFTNPTCDPYGHPGYWGHYLGHYFSATAMLIASNTSAGGDVDLRAKLTAMVDTMAQTQAAWTAVGPEYDGYLFPYSRVAWDNLFGAYGPSRNCDPVCVPFYVLHKVLAGMLDQYNLAGNAQALTIAVGIAKWVKTNVDAVLARGGQDLWQQVLSTEWGGMNDGLFNLYRITGDPDHLTAAGYFNHWSWSAPLAIGVDDLGGNHANTHIPEVIGDINGYMVTANATKAAIGNNFFSIIQQGHTWATGGSNDHEFWSAAWTMGSSLDDQTEESCTTYNILKVARNLFQVNGGSTYGDFYERALMNGLVGNQNRQGPYAPSANPNTVGFIYMLPLGPAVTKPWGDGINSGFPCCWGTLSETFAKLGDSIYFTSPPGAPGAPTLFVHLYVPSTVTTPWGAVVTQASGYPEDPDATTTITVAAAPASAFTLALRVPFWARPAEAVITVDGTPVPAAQIVPGAYVNITVSKASTVFVHFPAYLRWEPLQDNRPQFVNVGALLYGSILLTAVTNNVYFPLPPAGQLGAVITRNMTDPTALRFTTNVTGCGDVTLMPLYDIVFETYVTYLYNQTAATPIPYPPSGVTVLPGDGSGNLQVSGGASILDNGPALNIRSGDPGDVSYAQWVSPVQDATHRITGAAFSFSYTAGYGAAGAPGGSVMELVYTANGCNPSPSDATVVWTSPVLAGNTNGQTCSFDACNTCYCGPIAVNVPGLNIDVSTPTTFSLRFTDNQRNVQVLLPLNLTLTWA